MKTILGFLDFYKVTMAYFAWLNYPSVVVPYDFHNRHTFVPLGQIVKIEEVRERLGHIRQHLRFDPTVCTYIQEQLIKKGANAELVDKFIVFLAAAELPELLIEPDGTQLLISTQGPWPLSIWWETIVLSVVNELYVENLRREQGLTDASFWNEGDRILTAKINLIKNYPDVRILEFATRRRAGQDWQRHMFERLMNELPPGMLVGTSNTELAMEAGLDAQGTMAHELFMVIAALTYGQTDEILRKFRLWDSQGLVLSQWEGAFGGNLTIALSDTFGTPGFLDAFGFFAERWQGVRHDSGSSLEFGNRMLNFWRMMGIAAKTQTVVFSDGLTIHDIIGLETTFKGTFNRVYGWGTNLGFDVGHGIKPISIVMKAVAANGYGTVKLSDTPGKIQGNPDLVKVYKEVFGYERVTHRNIPIIY